LARKYLRVDRIFLAAKRAAWLENAWDLIAFSESPSVPLGSKMLEV
jgi:hypothetical protein